ncbi:MFS transporter [Rubrobacter marinus]|uniref:MFS transporter n=1 Tax=Rubrobacter marinus TaxID=2653852 RepID=A0A6G8Q0M6_9ACTN|nr:MFS transporter [Rubrobacter marinus]QIN80013.1 MFS transporter [Rubrobacter marinus]
MEVAGAPKVTRPGRALAWICAGHTLSHFWLLTLPPLFPAVAEFDIIFVQLGVLVTLYQLTNGLFQVPSGYLADRYGAKPVLVGGLLTNGTAFALYGLAPNYAVLLVLALVAGVGQSVFHPADYSLLSSAFSKERSGKPYSLHTFSGYAGSAVAPITVAVLYAALGWEWAFAAAGLAGMILALLVSLCLEAPRPVPQPEKVTREGGTGSGNSSLFLSQALLLMFAFYVFTSTASSGIQAFEPSSLAQIYEMPLSLANVALTVYLATLSFGILLGGLVADRVKSNHAHVVGVMFTGGTLLMLLLAVARPPVWLLFPILAVAGAFHGVIMPSRDKMVREATPEGKAGRRFGFVSTGLSLGVMAVPPIPGFAMDSGRPGLVFWAVAGFMLVAVLTTFTPRHGLRWRPKGRVSG